MNKHLGRGTVAVTAVCLSLVLALQLGPRVAQSNGSVDSFCSPSRSVQSFDQVKGANGAVFVAGPKPETVSAGHSPDFRVVNGAPRQLELVEVRTQRLAKGRWVEVQWPIGALSGFVVTILDPESVSLCMGPTTGPNWPAGKYRWLVAIRRVRNGFGRRHFIHATFWVRH